jgi:DNA-directed RNA polymerase specialized sigma24 family protein
MHRQEYFPPPVRVLPARAHTDGKMRRGEDHGTPMTQDLRRLMRGSAGSATTGQRWRRLIGASEDVGRAKRDTADAIAMMSDSDLLRLKALARLRARGLAGLAWTDLLHEAVVRALDGSRVWPPGISLVTFLAGAMRSICDEHWRRIGLERRILVTSGNEGAHEADHSPAADPERILAGGQALAALCGLFGHDEIVMKILVGLAEGMSALEIRRVHGLTETEYDTARRRMRRALLRHGLGGSE